MTETFSSCVLKKHCTTSCGEICSTHFHFVNGFSLSQELVTSQKSNVVPAGLISLNVKFAQVAKKFPAPVKEK